MLHQITKNKYVASPPKPSEAKYILDTNAKNQTFHICAREMEAQSQDVEILTMGLIHWCMWRAIYWCDSCRETLDAGELWSMGVPTPEDIEV